MSDAEQSATGQGAVAAKAVRTFVESSWQIIGECQERSDFEVCQFTRISSEQIKTDPLFKDFDGSVAGSERRFEAAGRARRGIEEEVNVEVAKRMQQHEAEVMRRIEQARAEGRAEGVVEAQAQGEAQLRELHEGVQGVLQDIQTQLNESIVSLERQAVELAVMIAEKVVGSVIEHNPEGILDIVKVAIDESGAAAIEAIRVSQRDYEFLIARNAAKELSPSESGWSFVADPTIRSGCVVKMRGSQVEYQLDAAWDRIRAQVLKSIAATETESKK